MPSGGDWTLDSLIKQVARTPTTTAHKCPGDSFGSGRYLVERELGRGGQKLVYLVKDTALDRPCALSLALPEHLDRRQIERFDLEAKALAKFGAQANIVTIYDIGEEEGIPYSLCEYLEGGDLRATLQEAPIEPIRALRIARDTASALTFAHERGVVHRDVTPGNIWLVGDGSAKLGDFGLALVTGQTRLTTPGNVLGTAAYLAPEQALGKTVDGRSDLYSLGCVLYEMLTGVPPFSADSAVAVVSQHIHAEPVSPDERNRSVGPKISALVMRLLAKDPADRPASAGDVASELERLIAALADPPDVGGSPCPVPENERERLEAVHALRILDTPAEPEYDEIAYLAAQICECPMSYVCFIDETRQWMKARHGVPAELAVAPREVGICQTTICQSDVLVAPDMSQDERFRALPPVADPPHLRFYCGVPLVTAQGHALGTLCVMDTVARQIENHQIEALRILARQVLARLELRQQSERLERTQRALAMSQKRSEESEQSQRLLRTLLPPEIVATLMRAESVEPRYHESVTIGVARLRGYPRLAAMLAPAQLVATLDKLLCAFDERMRQIGLEKLGAIGNAYHFVSGLPQPSRQHPVIACLGALALRACARNASTPTPWELSVGLHSGPAMSGVAGNWKQRYDLWGQSASLAARVEETAGADQILVSESTFGRVNHFFDCSPVEAVEVENRGTLRLYELARIRPELSKDGEGIEPSAAFAELLAHPGAPLLRQ